MDLTGKGALTFDNTDLVAFDGVPAPDGMLAFAVKGITVLLDRMIAAGMFSSEELNGLRFGLAFTANPGTGSNNLTTRIEFRDKSLILNGIKMRRPWLVSAERHV